MCFSVAVRENEVTKHVSDTAINDEAKNWLRHPPQRARTKS